MNFTDFIKACGFQNKIVYTLRDKNDNHYAHIALSILFSVDGFIKYLKKHRDKWNKNMAVVCIAKNEGPYIKEWVEFYKNQGIDNIILYDNDSTDNMHDELSEYISDGFVIYNVLSGRKRQYDAYHIAVDKYKNEYKYMAFLDCDEFLYCSKGNLYEKVDELFTKYNDVGGIAVNWLCFGSGGHETKPEGSVLSSYTKRAEYDFAPNHHVKSICNPRCILGFSNPHNPYYIKGFNNINENGVVIGGPMSESVVCEQLRINHYFTKSKEEFLNKIKRGMADSGNFRSQNEFDKFDRNEVDDEGILA